MSTQAIDRECLKSHVTNYRHWQRLIFMLLFAVLLHLAGAVMWVLCVLQFVFSVLTGKDNTNLRYLGGTIAQYIQQILHYLSYGSDSKPFPFAAWPEPVEEALTSENPVTVQSAIVQTATDNNQPDSSGQG